MSDEAELTKEQIMDLSVAQIDDRINRKQVFIKNLEDDVNKLLVKIERHKRELRNLGAERAKHQTFQLGL